MKYLLQVLLLTSFFMVEAMDLSQHSQNESSLDNPERVAQLVNAQQEQPAASTQDTVLSRLPMNNLGNIDPEVVSLKNSFVKKFGAPFLVNATLTNLHLWLASTCFNKTTCSIMEGMVRSIFSCGTGNQVCGSWAELVDRDFLATHLHNCVSKISCSRLNKLTGPISVLFQMVLGTVVRSHLDLNADGDNQINIFFPALTFLTIDALTTIIGNFSSGIGNPLVFAILLSLVKKFNQRKAATHELELEQKLDELNEQLKKIQ